MFDHAILFSAHPGRGGSESLPLTGHGRSPWDSYHLRPLMEACRGTLTGFLSHGKAQMRKKRRVGAHKAVTAERWFGALGFSQVPW